MYISPRWNIPPSVRAATSLRSGGVGQAPYRDFNIADHVGDDPSVVAENRARLMNELNLPSEPQWLRQEHGTQVANLDAEFNPQADAAYCTSPDRVCAIMTADCLPILLCSVDGEEIAAVHAGWRGLHAGVIAVTVARFESPGRRIRAWLGPAIGVDNYEVGEELRQRFVQHDRRYETAFTRSSGKPHLCLATIARLQLQDAGLSPRDISEAAICTYRDSARFFSYRRDGVTGRNATLIWKAARSITAVR